MRVRDAIPRDAAGIAAIWNPIIETSTHTFAALGKKQQDLARDIAEKQARGYAFLVGEGVAGVAGVAGFACYSPFRVSKGYDLTMEHTIYLAPCARGHGLGRRLMTALEARACAAGVHSLIAAITGGNNDAMRFHSALGFTEAGRVVQAGYKLGQWFDLVLMQKRL